ncbi:MAG: hypothetical protein WC683_04055 [bacterium]
MDVYIGGKLARNRALATYRNAERALEHLKRREAGATFECFDIGTGVAIYWVR